MQKQLEKHADSANLWQVVIITFVEKAYFVFVPKSVCRIAK